MSDNKSLEPLFNDTLSNADGLLKRNLRTQGRSASSATNTKVSVGLASTAVLADNSDRIEITIVNDSDEVVYLSLSDTAVMNEGIRLNAHGGAIINNTYTGAIAAICTTGTKNITVSEI